MSMHTLGPWCTGSSDLRVSMVSVHSLNTTAKHSTIARMVLPVKGGLTYSEIEANARLIAAAPLLLEALKEIVAGSDANEWNGVSTTKARAAIYKATGDIAVYKAKGDMV